MGSIVRRFWTSANTSYNGIYPGPTSTEDFTVTDTLTVGGAATFNSTVAMNGAVTVGDASTDTITMTGRLIVRNVTDAGPMTATAGTQGEIVFNTSDSKFYGCTVTHASAATWAALH